MPILEEAARLATQYLGPEADLLTVDRVVVGLFFTGVKLSDGSGGVCYTPVKDIPAAVCCPTSAGRSFDPTRVTGSKAKTVLEALSSLEPIKTAVAIATLNAVTSACWNRGMGGPYQRHLRRDAQDWIPLGEGLTVAVVGAFVPVLKALKTRGGTWWVIEQDPRTLRDDELSHYVPAHRAADVLPRADVAVITGVTLVNHTLEPLLAGLRTDAVAAVMGPTASMTPEPLFERGVRIVGGVWARETDRLLDVLAAGGSGYHFFDTLADRTVLLRSP